MDTLERRIELCQAVAEQLHAVPPDPPRRSLVRPHAPVRPGKYAMSWPT